MPNSRSFFSSLNFNRQIIDHSKSSNHRKRGSSRARRASETTSQYSPLIPDLCRVCQRANLRECDMRRSICVDQRGRIPELTSPILQPHISLSSILKFSNIFPQNVINQRRNEVFALTTGIQQKFYFIFLRSRRTDNKV